MSEEKNLLEVSHLKQYFPVKPGLVIKDRMEMGDIYKKPTQFFFINCEPKFKLYNSCFVKVDDKKTIKKTGGFARSVISLAFAKNFIETYIVDQWIKNILQMAVIAGYFSYINIKHIKEC